MRLSTVLAGQSVLAASQSDDAVGGQQPQQSSAAIATPSGRIEEPIGPPNAEAAAIAAPTAIAGSARSFQTAADTATGDTDVLRMAGVCGTLMWVRGDDGNNYVVCTGGKEHRANEDGPLGEDLRSTAAVPSAAEPQAFNGRDHQYFSAMAQHDAQLFATHDAELSGGAQPMGACSAVARIPPLDEDSVSDNNPRAGPP